jgi:hypothetical protein
MEVQQYQAIVEQQQLQLAALQAQLQEQVAITELAQEELELVKNKSLDFNKQQLAAFQGKLVSSQQKQHSSHAERNSLLLELQTRTRSYVTVNSLFAAERKRHAQTVKQRDKAKKERKDYKVRARAAEMEVQRVQSTFLAAQTQAACKAQEFGVLERRLQDLTETKKLAEAQREQLKLMQAQLDTEIARKQEQATIFQASQSELQLAQERYATVTVELERLKAQTEYETAEHMLQQANAITEKLRSTCQTLLHCLAQNPSSSSSSSSSSSRGDNKTMTTVTPPTPQEEKQEDFFSTLGVQWTLAQTLAEAQGNMKLLQSIVTDSTTAADTLTPVKHFLCRQLQHLVLETAVVAVLEPEPELQIEVTSEPATTAATATTTAATAAISMVN